MKTMKKSLALFLTLMLALSSLSVAAFAGDEVGALTMTARDSTKVVFTLENAPAGTQVVIVVADNDVTALDESYWNEYTVTNGSVTIPNISNPYAPASQEYEVVARYLSDGSYKYVESSAFRFVPATPTELTKTDKELTFAAVAGIEYRLDDGNFTADPTFKDLTPGKEYTLYFRFASEGATSTIKEGPLGKKTFKTKLGKPATPAAPTFVTCTMDSITVSAPKGYGLPVEYTIVGSNEWNSTGVFEGLKKGTTYSIAARGAATEEQLEGDMGPAIKVTTSSRETFKANTELCLIITPSKSVSSGQAASVTARGSSPSGSAEFGDTRLVPVSWKASTDTGDIGSGVWSDGKSSQTFGIATKGLAIPNGNLRVDVSITYEEQEYDGKNWVSTGSTFVKTSFFNVVPVNYFELIISAISSLITGIVNAIQNASNFIKNFFNS